MKTKLVSSIISIFIITFALGQIADAQNRSVLMEAERITGDQFAITMRTPKGALVYAVRRP